MCDLCTREMNQVPLARRHVLKSAAAAAGLVFAARAEAAKPKPANVLSTDAPLKRLMAGNARYVGGVSRRHDFKHEREALSAGQNPFAAVLSCADSRIAPEYCFDTARGDVFVCRVAGNFASDDIAAPRCPAISGAGRCSPPGGRGGEGRAWRHARQCDPPQRRAQRRQAEIRRADPQIVCR
jgi:hypothetical protein